MASHQSSNATRYKGNDIDPDGDGSVGSADDATTVKGNDIDQDGDGIVDKADTSVDRPKPGQNITEDGSGNFNVTLSTSVEASETDDGSDITKYINHTSANSTGSNLVNVTGSGVLLGGIIFSDNSFANNVESAATVTVDGGTSFKIDVGDNGGTYYGHIPPIRFESSLTITYDFDSVGGSCWVKQ